MVYTLRFFSLQNAVCFIILTYLVPVLFHILYTGVLKFKKNNSGAKCLNTSYFHTTSPTDLLDPSPAPRFKNFPVISALLSEVPKFQYPTILCSKCSNFLVPSFNLSQIPLGMPTRNCRTTQVPSPSFPNMLLYVWKSLDTEPYNSRPINHNAVCIVMPVR